MVVPIQGGLVRVLADSSDCCVRWGVDGFIYYSADDRTIRRVPASGGQVEQVTERSAENDGSHGYFQILPGGAVGVFTVWATPRRIEAMDMATGRRVVLTEGVRSYVTPTGHLVFASVDGRLFAASFDEKGMELSQTPVPLIDGIGVGLGDDVMYSLSESGTLVYWTGSGQRMAQRRLAVVYLADSTEVLSLTPQRFGGPRWSPDGNSIAYFGDDTGTRQVFTYDIESETTPRQLTFVGENRYPVWSPDGSRLAFTSRREGTEEWDLFVRTVNDDAPEERILTLPGTQWVRSWPEDDLAVFENGPNPSSFWTFAPSGGENPTAYLDLDEDLEDVVVSPAGGWAAYQSDETGMEEVYVRSFQNPRQQVSVSQGGGQFPRWSADGKTLYYWQRVDATVDTLFAASVETEPTFTVRSREVALVGEFVSPEAWDLHPDGDRIIVLLPAEEAAEGQLILVQNFVEELKERVPN